jgi:hypothetical protein
MAPDDRDFEKALARHLRSVGGEAPAMHSGCADAETLAAYHERLLAPSELHSWKGHIAGCARCQEILAQLEATDEIPLGAPGESLASSVVVAMQPSVTPAPAQPRRFSHLAWRWAVPAGALAAGLLIWIVSRESRLQESVLRPVSEVEVSQEHHAEVTRQSSASSGANAQSAQTQQPSKDLATNTGQQSLDAKVGRMTQESDQRQMKPDLDRAESPKLRKAVPSIERGAQQYDDSPRSREAAQGRPQQQAPALADQVSPRLKQQDLQGIAGAEQSEKGAGVAGGTIPPAPSSAPVAPPAPDVGLYARRDSTKKERVEPKDKAPFVAAQNQTVSVSGEASAMLETSTALIGTTGPRIFPVPGAQIIWKIDEDGRVRRSSDLGATWLLQDTGVNATLLSGAAPSEKVCWLVGTFGTVLLTTDGGAHWTRHTLPVTAPADRITAFDAQHAIVTLRASTVQFETFDAGQTWSLVKKK